MLWNFIQNKGTLKGIIEMSDLPVHEMCSVAVTLFEVANADSPAPYEGKPPPEAYKNEHSVKETGDAPQEPLRFELQVASGVYYVDVGFIVYFKQDNRMFAQVEHFWPLEKPLRIARKKVSDISLQLRWPDIPVAELGAYGTVRPG